MLIVEPVLMRPLRRQWEAVKKEAGPLRNETADIRNQLSKLKGEGKERDRLNKALKATQKKLGILYSDFAHSISQVKVLDPACGSGNFLYVALRQLKYLQREVIVEARDAGVAGIMPDADPGQLYGMEINPYAHELAQVVVWIGYIQWHVQNGYGFPREPILRSLDNIKRMDALLVWTDTPVTPARHADESRHPETNERLDPGKARHTGESRYPETNGELGPDFRRDDGQKVSPPATPAKAGVQKSPEKLDPDFRRDDADVALPATNSKPEARRSEWPEADVIIGNPPFLGGKRLRNSLGDEYVDALFKAYGKDVALEADLSVYWHERARALIEKGKVKRAGLLATQGIRGGANQKTLRRILETGNIFEAWSDRDWFLAGAAVHVSIICQDAKAETEHLLDGQCVPAIHADLSSAHGADVTRAVRLSENFDLGFMGDTKGGKFDIDPETAKALLAGKNPNGKSNKSVVVPWVNGADLTRRSRGWYIIDFNEMPLEEACQYESPFEYVRQYVFPERMQNNRQSYRDKWWVHVEPRPAMRAALEPLTRFIGTATTAKYRLFSWFTKPTLPDHAIIVFAREDDYFFGVLHSVAHERWALELGTQLEDRPRYTPTTCFETFPFSWPPGKEKQNDPQVKAIAAAAKSLNDQRETWLNPKGISEAEL
ncbi:MAG: class I SAM-dependent DNA methyltransferase, partial [Planctomycetaceae bacterium]|nr:class I SAM-dependent DNA methyltransferase [Planctomycetaceae bacterium]